MNIHFLGTYNASLILEANEPGLLADSEAAASVAALQDLWSGFGEVGQGISYVDVVAAGSAPETIPGDRDGMIRVLESAAASPGRGGVAGLITADYRKANVQILLREGDNQVMKRVVDRTEDYLASRPLPAGIRASWAGETYLNLVWQDEMVSGMLTAFLGTFVVVLLLMVALSRCGGRCWLCCPCPSPSCSCTGR